MIGRPLHRRFLGTRLKSHRFPFEKLTVIQTRCEGRIVVVTIFKDRNLDGEGQVLAIQERPLLEKLL